MRPGACTRTHTHTLSHSHTHTQGIAIGDELVAGDPTGLSKPEIKKLRIANTQAAFDAMMEGYKAIGGYDQGAHWSTAQCSTAASLIG